MITANFILTDKSHLAKLSFSATLKDKKLVDDIVDFLSDRYNIIVEVE